MLRSKDVHLSYRELRRMRRKLIEIDRLQYKKNEDTGKIELYVLSPDYTRMKTYENFKNKVRKYVSFTTKEGLFTTFYYLKGDRQFLDSVYASDVRCYYIEGFYGIDDPEFTTIGEVDKFIEKAQRAFDKKLGKVPNNTEKENNEYNYDDEDDDDLDDALDDM